MYVLFVDVECTCTCGARDACRALCMHVLCFVCLLCLAGACASAYVLVYLGEILHPDPWRAYIQALACKFSNVPAHDRDVSDSTSVTHEYVTSRHAHPHMHVHVHVMSNRAYSYGQKKNMHIHISCHVISRMTCGRAYCMHMALVYCIAAHDIDQRWQHRHLTFRLLTFVCLCIFAKDSKTHFGWGVLFLRGIVCNWCVVIVITHFLS